MDPNRQDFVCLFVCFNFFYKKKNEQARKERGPVFESVHVEVVAVVASGLVASLGT